MSGKHILLKGAFVLTLTGFATRFMGFFYRIFLSRAFGEEGVGLYQLVFPVYALCFSLTCAGIETAISRCVAKKTATGQPKEALGLLYTGLFLTLTASCCATLFLQNFAGWIADVFLQEPRCSHLLVILSYAFPFAAAHSCIVGYYLGQKATRIPASSQLVEQTVRILSVYLLYWIGAKNGASFGISVAVAGLAAGELASSAFCLRAVLREVPRKSRSRLRFFSFFKYARELLTFSLPLTANRVLLNILQSAEAISIPLRLQIYGMSSKEALSAYGVLTGMALPCVLFPSAITNSLSTMLLPTVAEIQAADNRKALSGIIQKSVYSCVFMGSVCCVALLCFGQWLGVLLFDSSLAGDFIVTLAWICPFLYAGSTLISILNGLGKTALSFLINAGSLTVRVGSVFFLIPVFGIQGYLWGLLASQVCVFVFCGVYLYIWIRSETPL